MTTSLQQAAVRYSFQRLVWLLQRAQPDAVRVGHQGPPSRETIRFRPVLGLEFPSTEVCRVRERDADGAGSRFEVATNFFGLYGTPSPLPASYTEDLIQDGEEGLARGFLDLFNHRLISLFYRAMVKYRFSWQFTWQGEDPISRRLQLLCGVPPNSIRLLAFASVLRARPLPAAGLLSVLRAYLGDVPVELVQCVPQWIPIPKGQQCRLGESYSNLGSNACLGERVHDRSNTFRVVLGPLPARKFMDFLPGEPRMIELCELIDLFNRDQLDYEVQLILDPEEETELRLGSRTAALGWSTWLGRPETTSAQKGPTVSFLFHEWCHE